MGEWDWSAAIAGLALPALFIFLIGARNEYGDNHDDGVVIHVYLVYALGLLMVDIPLLMARGLITFALVCTLARLFIQRGRKL